MENKPALTFIIPHREVENIAQTAAAVKASCEKTGVSYEIFSVSGNHPTKQRNRCIERGRNAYIYFIDNDSVVTPNALEEFKKLLGENREFSVLAGPTLTPPSDTELQKNFNAVLTSFFTTGKMSARYMKKGAVRETDDSEIILCNLIIKKNVFTKHGLFNEKLYPNEENEFVYRIKSRGEKVIYDPEFCIFRSQRETLEKFIKQIFNYGRGRGEQTRVSPESFKPSIMVPVLFSLYMVLFPLTVFFPADRAMLFSVPIYLYVFLDLMSWITISLRDKKFYSYYPILFCITHVMYGLGFIYGFFKKGFKANEVDFKYQIEKVD